MPFNRTYLGLFCLLFCQMFMGSAGSGKTEVSCGFGSTGAHFTRPPILRNNPNPSVPMAAIVEFGADRPVLASVFVKSDDTERLLYRSSSFKYQYSLPVLGLRPGRTEFISIVVTDLCGVDARWPLPMEIVTEPLPEDFPKIETNVSNVSMMEPGVTLFNVSKPNRPDFGLLIAVNEAGEVVWYYRSNKSISDARKTSNGHILLIDAAGVAELDVLGNIVGRWHASGLTTTAPDWSLPVATDTIHHEIYEFGHDGFLSLGTEVRRLAKYPDSETNPSSVANEANVVGDLIMQFRRDGTILHQWSLLDILDPYRIGFGSLSSTWNLTYDGVHDETRDWSHANAVIPDHTDDSLIVSVRHQDAVVKIDRKSGRLIWILGNPGGWSSSWNRYLLAPEGNVVWPYHQHAPEITPQGTLLLFDNGNQRRRPFEDRREENYSRAVEYGIDEARMTVSEIWSYGGPGDEVFFSGALGDADWLPNTGNVLLTDGARFTSATPRVRFARIVEVTRTKPAVKVFELIIKNAAGQESGWQVYRSERLPSLYFSNP